MVNNLLSFCIFFIEKIRFFRLFVSLKPT